MDTLKQGNVTPPFQPSKLISMYQAANILGVSKKTVSKLGKQGLLVVVTQGRLRRFYKNEVLQLKKMREFGVRTRDIQEHIVSLKYRLERIKLLARTVTSRIGISETPVTFKDYELMVWYESAVQLKHQEDIDIRNINLVKWLNLSKNLHELEFKRLKHLRGDPAPFIPFIAVCERLSTLARAHQSEETHLPISFLDWSNLFLAARDVLRERAINFFTHEPPDFAPIKRVDFVTSFSQLGSVSTLMPQPAPKKLQKALEKAFRQDSRPELDFGSSTSTGEKNAE